jgi:hypothetical protein
MIGCCDLIFCELSAGVDARLRNTGPEFYCIRRMRWNEDVCWSLPGDAEGLRFSHSTRLLWEKWMKSVTVTVLTTRITRQARPKGFGKEE